MSISSKFRHVSRPLRHRLLLIFLKLTCQLFSYLPLQIGQRLGICLGIGVNLAQNSINRLIDTNLVAIYPPHHLPVEYASIQQLRKAHWRDLGRRLGEWLVGNKALHLFHLSAETKQHLDKIQESAQKGQAHLLLTAHFGHWELMAAYLSKLGYDFVAVATHQPTSALGHWLKNYRNRLGVKTIHPHGGAKQICKLLKNGGIVAMLIDQSTHEKSISLPFLGQAAPHSLTADRLAKQLCTQVHWIQNCYTKETGYLISLTTLTPPADPSTKRSHYVQQAHLHLEQLILTQPQQWVWLHQRWTKRRQHKL